MARIEKTVFISYRRTDVYTALAVYENLKNQGYDVFFDYRSISSGDFEQIITSNIRARAHFLIILTPTALDRLNEPGDWLRREIEIAIEEKRNIIPLFFKGFLFGTAYVSDKLTGKLKTLSRYNGLNVHEDYFDEAMQRLRMQFLSKPLDTVLHPVSTEVQKVVKAEQVAADKALQQENVKELVRQAEEKSSKPKVEPEPKLVEQTPFSPARKLKKEEKPQPKRESLPKPVASEPKVAGSEALSQTQREALPWHLIAGIAGGLALISLCIWGGINLWNNLPSAVPEPTWTKAVLGPTWTSQPTASGTPKPAITNTPSPTKTPIPPIPTLGIGSTMTGKDGMTLLYVPAGEFTMGSDSGESDEKPVHTVYLDAFWIDQTEVTNAMYAKCVKEKKCNSPRVFGGWWDVLNNPEFANYPVRFISWYDAKEYCGWAERRLSTEAEWEKAARGTDGRTYPWGNDAPNDNLLNYNNFSNTYTLEVGKYPNGASPYGALDMAGNVMEWVADWYDANFYAYSRSINPLGPADGRDHVLRSSDWYESDIKARSSRRTYDNDKDISWFWEDDHVSAYVGFRCAMSATP